MNNTFRRSLNMNQALNMYRALKMAFINFLCIVAVWTGLDILVSLFMHRAWAADLTTPVPIAFMSIAALIGSVAMFYFEKDDDKP